MTGHLTQIRAQQHIADMQRTVDRPWLAAKTTPSGPIDAVRQAPRPWIVRVTRAQAAQRLKRLSESLTAFWRTTGSQAAPRPSTNKE